MARRGAERVNPHIERLPGALRRLCPSHCVGRLKVSGFPMRAGLDEAGRLDFVAEFGDPERDQPAACCIGLREVLAEIRQYVTPEAGIAA